ncbi:hypothetical protein HanIR_Chr04g0182941 [Helianthus annuus]|nr:hypothetical protein HanIR_Chr04g0182941 [Helianthus annuus]
MKYFHQIRSPKPCVLTQASRFTGRTVPKYTILVLKPGNLQTADTTIAGCSHQNRKFWSPKLRVLVQTSWFTCWMTFIQEHGLIEPFFFRPSYSLRLLPRYPKGRILQSNYLAKILLEVQYIS